MKPTKSEVVAFLRDQLAGEEKHLKARIQAEKTWREGTDASWRAVGCRMTKAQRLNVAEREKRIGIKVQKRIELFKAAIALLDGRERNEFPEVP